MGQYNLHDITRVFGPSFWIFHKPEGYWCTTWVGSNSGKAEMVVERRTSGSQKKSYSISFKVFYILFDVQFPEKTVINQTWFQKGSKFLKKFWCLLQHATSCQSDALKKQASWISRLRISWDWTGIYSYLRTCTTKINQAFTAGT